MTLRRLPSAWLAIAMGLAAAAPAWAQDRLIFAGRDVGAIGRFGQDLGQAPTELVNGSPFAGGRYLLGDPVVDRRSGARIALPFGWQPLLGDPVRPRVYAWTPPIAPGADGAITTFDVETGATTTLMRLPDPGAQPYSLRVAVDADVIFALDLGIFGSLTGRVHLASGVGGLSTQREIQLPPREVRGFDVTPDGETLLASTFVSGDATSRLQAYDVATGALSATAADDRAGGVEWDATLNGLIVTGGSTIRLFSRQLTVLAEGSFGSGCPSSIRVSPHTGRVYVVNGGGHYFSIRFPQFLQVLDTTTGRWTGPVDVTRSLTLPSECETLLQLYTAPGTPRGLTGTVSGNTVSLRWQHVGAAHTFVLAAGVGPGRTDATVTLGPDSQVTFSGVPPGTYYLRMRGVNEFGAGRWSNEVRVVVP